ncbi:MAG TPA: TIGR03960 family B12-binding radical SAM protein [bacterium]|nr:TIGR03960 family B12-binding radical SAM protein [bacterium]
MELEVLPRVERPGRYAGGELNSARGCGSDPSALRVVLCFPEVYEIGMSNLGFMLLYHLLNGIPGVECERAFAPWPDMERELSARGLPLYSLESFTPLSEFDIVGFSLSYEMTYTNILTMLSLGGVGRRTADRANSGPLVIAGGVCACNPEPLADFFDAFFIGEAEEGIVDIVEAARASKKRDSGKSALLNALADIPGVYVPSLCETFTTPSGLAAVSCGTRGNIKRRFPRDLDSIHAPPAFIVPGIEAVHDRIQIEIFRGCVQGCRYCQAGMIYRPHRERGPRSLSRNARDLFDAMGCDEISLLSLNAPDYSDMGELLDSLSAFAAPRRVSISMPSTRVDSFSEEVYAKLREVRATGLTLAPEAGSQRLRNVINKRVTEEDIMKTVSAASRAGWKKIKLYFMIGLPTETEEDVRGIAELVARMVETRGRSASRVKGKQVFTVSVSNFIPKPHTPFQWEPMDSMESLIAKKRILRGLIDRRAVKLDMHDVETSFLEAALARGDRRLCSVIERAWLSGCRFDGWSDMLKFDAWTHAFASSDLNPDLFARASMQPLSPTPWSHIDCGVSEKYLFLERNKALRGETTPDCGPRGGGCSGCGIDCSSK